jgi:hypothetical protein
LQGLYPYCNASLAEEKKSTFSSLGFLAVHVGLQKTPVVLTPTKNIPSKLLSLFSRAVYIVFLSGINKSYILITLILISGDKLKNI